MNCYNHIDRPAVAACKVCGKSLCKECADKYTPFLCDECYAKLRKEEFESLKRARRKIITTFIWGIIFFIVFFFGFNFEFWSALWCFVIPFGWSYFSDINLPEYVKYLHNGGVQVIIFYIFKILFALIAGIPVLIYAIYKLVKLSKAVKTAEIENL